MNDSSDISLSALAAAYAKAKAEESRITARRRELADKIQAVTGHVGEGQKTYAVDGWKVAVKVPLIQSIDWDVWETIKSHIPQNRWPIEMKPSLDVSGVAWIKENDPETYAILAKALTVKPGSVQVTVKEVDHGV